MLLRLENISLDYSKAPLFNKINLVVNANERVCLVGRNGAGKSSLLKIIEGTVAPDEGKIYKDPNIKISKLSQDIIAKSDKTVISVVAEGLSEVGDLLQEYHNHLSLSDSDDSKFSQDDWLSKLENLQQQIELLNGWEYDAKIETVLKKLNLNPNVKLEELSGGLRRRVCLARALVQSPDILLLDEPTNHLDLESILWMEEFLLNFDGTIIYISHDRRFIERLSTRIIEIDRGNIFSYPGNYQNYLILKEKRLLDEDNANALFDKKLADEEVWIRQGIKARRTRNEGRVRALQALRDERSKRRELMKKPSFNLNKTELSGKLVINANKISQKFNNKQIIDNFSCKIFRGDRIGILGPNGSGKTTLLRILLKNLEPTEGSVELGTNLEIAYFDQLRSQIDPNLTVVDNVAHGRTSINVNGKEKHVISYLNDFLFTPDRSRTPVSKLSGGECNRLLLARLFSLPANLLVLDEPTNDLDMETLDLLEEILINYEGTILLVSHDRAFMDNVVTQVFSFEENGKITEYVGSYSDWLEYQDSKKLSRLGNDQVNQNYLENNYTDESSSTFGNDLDLNLKNSNVLSRDERKELSSIVKKIEKTEEKIANFHKEIADLDFYDKDIKFQTKKLSDLKILEKELETLMDRWTSLEDRNS